MFDFSRVRTTEKKVTDREYRAKQDGQEKLEEVNRAVIADGLKPRRTKYETIKEQICVAVDNAVHEAEDEDDFFDLLNERYHIEVTTSRGSWSYLYSLSCLACRLDILPQLSVKNQKNRRHRHGVQGRGTRGMDILL